MAPPNPEGTAELLVEVRFTATHRILVGGELEPAHGHDFRILAVFAAGSADPDPSAHARLLAAELEALAYTDLAPVARSQGGHPSAERLAAHVYAALCARGLAVLRVTAHEAPGCAASYSRPARARI